MVQALNPCILGYVFGKMQSISSLRSGGFDFMTKNTTSDKPSLSFSQSCVIWHIISVNSNIKVDCASCFQFYVFNLSCVGIWGDIKRGYYVLHFIAYSNRVSLESFIMVSKDLILKSSQTLLSGFLCKLHLALNH